jgi:hypothetical protein
LIFSPLRWLALLILAGSLTLPRLVVPNFPDLTFKTRVTFGEWSSSIETLHLKGSRQRNEQVAEKPARPQMYSATITQCDQKRVIRLNDAAKTYVSNAMPEGPQQTRPARPVPPDQMTGADVTVTIDSVDTGERRQIGSYKARHVKTTITTKPGPGAATPTSIEEIEDWYIDLPGMGCEEATKRTRGLISVIVATGPVRQDRVHIENLRTTLDGYAVEETIRNTEAGHTVVTKKVELLEFSEAPLDASLFELPADYSPALRNPRGDFDMTRPDTLSNRLQSYWAEMTTSVQRWFR